MSFELSEDSGYDLSLFIEIPMNNLLCSICKNVLKDAKQCTNGHMGCSNCLHKWLKDYKKKVCPECTCKLTKENLSTSLLANTQINDLKVKCRTVASSGSIGCDWTGKLSDLDGHLQTCEYVKVHCSSGCGAEIRRRELDSHSSSLCSLRSIVCPLCTLTFTYKEFKGHHVMNCPMSVIKCTNDKCETILTRSSLEEHITKCKWTVVTCPLFAKGNCTQYCREKYANCEIEQHFSFSSFAKALARLESRVETLETELRLHTVSNDKSISDEEKSSSPSVERPIMATELTSSEPSIDDDEIMLIYPFIGENQVKVTWKDFRELDSGGDLTDSIIDVTIRESLHRTAVRTIDVHIFSSEFYSMLTNDGVPGNRNITEGIDIFSKEFIVVPFERRGVAWIVNPSNIEDCVPQGTPVKKRKRPVCEGSSPANTQEGRGLDSSDQSTATPTDHANTLTREETEANDRMRMSTKTKSGSLPACIIIMDSGKDKLFTKLAILLRSYLQDEWFARHGTAREFNSTNLPAVKCAGYEREGGSIKIPGNDKDVDKGVWLLKYVDMVRSNIFPLNAELKTVGQITTKRSDSIQTIIGKCFADEKFSVQDLENYRSDIYKHLVRLSEQWKETPVNENSHLLTEERE